MDEIVKYTYTEEFLKRASREILLPRLGRLLAVIVTISLALILAMGGITGFVLGAWFILGPFLMGMILRYKMQLVEQAKSPHQMVTLTFNEDGITFDNVDYIAIVKWRRFHSIKKLKSAWLLFYSGDSYVAIPADVLSNSIKALIDKKMAENHARIH